MSIRQLCAVFMVATGVASCGTGTYGAWPVSRGGSEFRYDRAVVSEGRPSAAGTSHSTRSTVKRAHDGSLADLHAAAPLKPFTPEWYERERRIDARLRERIVICKGCLKPSAEKNAVTATGASATEGPYTSGASSDDTKKLSLRLPAATPRVDQKGSR